MSSAQSVMKGSGNPAGKLEQARSRTDACIQMGGLHMKMGPFSSPFPSIVPSSSSLIPSLSFSHSSQSEASMRTSCSFSTQSFSSGVGSSGGGRSGMSTGKNIVRRERSTVGSQNKERHSGSRSICRRSKD